MWVLQNQASWPCETVPAWHLPTCMAQIITVLKHGIHSTTYAADHMPSVLTWCCVPPALTFSSPVLQAMRLTLVQVLMNSKGYNMNPLQSLYYVSPACLLSLLLPFGEALTGAAGAAMDLKSCFLI